MSQEPVSPAAAGNNDRDEAILDRFGVKLFLIVVGAAYAVMFADKYDQWQPQQMFSLIILGLAYCVVFLYVWEYIPEQRWLIAGYFAFQLILTAAIQYISDGATGLWLIPLPLVAQAAERSLRRGLLVSAGIWFFWTLLLTNWIGRDVGAVINNSLLFIPALAFTAFLTRAAVREEEVRREVERLAAALRQANQQLRAYAVQAEDLATTKERNRLARDIHDSLGHYLTVVNVQLSAAQAIMDSDPERAREAVGKAQELTQKGLAEIRSSVATLRESPLDGRSLTGAIDELVAASRASGVAAELRVDGIPRPLSPQTEMTLYRAAQEGITNIRKHAQATRADLALVYLPAGLVRLTIVDDGVGSEKADGGFGLLGLRERAQLLGGEVQVQTAPGAGFRLTIQLPG